jgi:hypothetical protein
VSLVDHSLRTVSVEQVDSEEEGLGEKREGSMSFDQEVDQIRSHEPLNLLLNIDRGDIREGLVLSDVSKKPKLTVQDS